MADHPRHHSQYPAPENDADSIPGASPAPSASAPGERSRTPADSAATTLRSGVALRSPSSLLSWLPASAKERPTAPGLGNRRHGRIPHSDCRRGPIVSVPAPCGTAWSADARSARTLHKNSRGSGWRRSDPGSDAFPMSELAVAGSGVGAPSPRLQSPERRPQRVPLTARGESLASIETVPAPAGQGAIRVHTRSMYPNRNAVRRDAGTVECRDDFCHGLLRSGLLAEFPGPAICGGVFCPSEPGRHRAWPDKSAR